MRARLILLLAVFLAAIPAAARGAPTPSVEATGFFAKGRAAMRAHQYEEAASWLEKAAAAAPERSEYHQWLGRALGLYAARAGMAKGLRLAGRVRSEMERAVALDPANLEAKRDLAIYFTAAPAVVGGSKDKARALVAEIQARDPAFGWLTEGDLLVAADKITDATACYAKSARSNPARPDAFLRLALVAQRDKEWERAFSHLDRALAVSPAHPGSVFQVGRTGAMSGQQLDRAEAALRRYFTLPSDYDDPPPAAARFRLGQVLEKRGDRAAAKAEYEAALRLDPQNKGARAALAKLGG